MTWFASAVDGQDSSAQSRTPYPKSGFEHRQVTSFGAQPNEGASASMFLMHVDCEGVSD